MNEDTFATLKIVILGESGIGKSSILHSFLAPYSTDLQHRTEPTIGFIFYNFTYFHFFIL